VLLSVKNISVHYGKAIAINQVSINVGEESIVSILGANGAGKSTIMKSLSGLVPLTSGEIQFLERRIDVLATHEIAKSGLIHVPEGRKLFPYLTVQSNINLGATVRKDCAGIKRDMEEVFRYFPILQKRLDQKAGTLSGGEQEMLAIARGLMAKPRLLLLDEPSLGLAPLIIASLVPVIKNIRKRGVSVLLVEQNIPMAFEVADMGYVLHLGRVVMEGDREALKASGIFRKAYLGSLGEIVS
jgi:branched-chain amino acid transport system ATP-binding protein